MSTVVSIHIDRQGDCIKVDNMIAVPIQTGVLKRKEHNK